MRKGGEKVPQQVPSGLESTVKELLKDYKPTSSERRPFWCRLCMYQGECIEDLQAHKQSDLHRLAEEKEKKMRYCKLCRKDFTSIDQLKAHLQGKSHKERLANCKQRVRLKE